MWNIVKHYSTDADTLQTKVDGQQAQPQSQSAQSNNPRILIDRFKAENKTNSRKLNASSTKVNFSLSGAAIKKPSCGVHCRKAIDVLKLSYPIADHEYDEYHSLAEQLAAYLQSNSQRRNQFLDIAAQAGGNKRKIIMAAFGLLPEIDRLMLGQALIGSNSEHSRLDGVQLLASTEVMSQYWVNEFSELLLNEKNDYVRQSVVQALNRPDLFKGDAKVLTMLSQVIQTEGDASVRGEALLVSARLTHEPQSLLHDSFSAIRSEKSTYQQYGVRAMEEIFSRHTQDGGDLSASEINQLEQLVADLMGPEFDNIPGSIRSDIEDLYERFH